MAQELDIPFYRRELSAGELEQFRLLLSTYCDGSGATNSAVPWTVPDYRDFERVVAELTGGKASENKSIFDVTVPVPSRPPFGISCKMAGPGSPLDPDSAFIEMTNSSKKLTDAFRAARIVWQDSPTEAGVVAVELIQSWHADVADRYDLASSAYLLLTHSNDWHTFKLSSFPLDLSLAEPSSEIRWEVRHHRQTGMPNSLHGYLDRNGTAHRIWELYPESGGQVKYRPLWAWSDWNTGWFSLEIPPVRQLRQQAKLYFPALWRD